jgi:hypothetical protein
VSDVIVIPEFGDVVEAFRNERFPNLLQLKTQASAEDLWTFKGSQNKDSVH